MSTSRAEIIAEIQRLDGELQRITRELEQLRLRVEPPRSGRTQAFPSPISSAPAHSKSAPTSEIPSTQPSSSIPAPSQETPSPSAPVRTSTRTIAPSRDKGERRVASPSIGLDSPMPAPAVPSPSRPRRDSPPREVGRYGYIEKTAEKIERSPERSRSSSRR